MAGAPSLQRHSRLVAWGKVLLPLTALAILSTLFLLARRIDPGTALPFAAVDLEAYARDPRMTGPAFSGVLPDGRALMLRAEEARPASDATPATARALYAELSGGGSPLIRFRAGSGSFDAAAQILRLEGGVVIESEGGSAFAFSATALRFDISEGRAESEGPTQGRTAFGEITAARAQITGPREAAEWRFDGGVVLVYRPKS